MLLVSIHIGSLPLTLRRGFPKSRPSPMHLTRVGDLQREDDAGMA